MAGWRWLLLYFWMVPERGWQRDTVLSSMPFAQRCSGLGGGDTVSWLAIDLSRLITPGRRVDSETQSCPVCLLCRDGSRGVGGYSSIYWLVTVGGGDDDWEGLTARRSLVQYAFCVEMFGHTFWDLAIDIEEEGKLSEEAEGLHFGLLSSRLGDGMVCSASWLVGHVREGIGEGRG